MVNVVWMVGQRPTLPQFDRCIISLNNNLGGIILKHNVILLIVLFLFLVSACSPSDQIIQEAIEQTQTAFPTSTLAPTPIPLSEYNLKNILLVEGDLPEGYEVNPFITDISDTKYGDLNGVEYFLGQEFSKTDEGGGHVVIFLFDSEEERNRAFYLTMSDNYDEIKKLNENTDIKDITDVGEMGKLIMSEITVMSTSIKSAQIGFVRCHAFVLIGKTVDDSSTILAYARKLDERLSDTICLINSH